MQLPVNSKPTRRFRELRSFRSQDVRVHHAGGFGMRSQFERAPSIHQFSTLMLGLSTKHHERFLLIQSCKSESRSKSRCRCRRRHRLRFLKDSLSCPPHALYALSIPFRFLFPPASTLFALCLVSTIYVHDGLGSFSAL